MSVTTLNPATLTYTTFDVEQPVSLEEDKEATEIAFGRFTKAMDEKMQTSFAKGWGGWNRPSECSTQRLLSLFEEAVRKGDIVDIGNYAMMLHGRGVTNINVERLNIRASLLSEKIAQLVEAEATLAKAYGDNTSPHSALEKVQADIQFYEQERQHIWGLIKKGA